MKNRIFWTIPIILLVSLVGMKLASAQSKSFMTMMMYYAETPLDEIDREYQKISTANNNKKYTDQVARLNSIWSSGSVSDRQFICSNSDAELFEEADITSAKVATVAKNTRLLLFEVSDDGSWKRVSFPSQKKEGWIQSSKICAQTKVVRRDPPPRLPPTGSIAEYPLSHANKSKKFVCNTRGKGLLVRLGPGTGYNKAGGLDEGRRVFPISENSNGSWLKISYFGKDRWISAKHTCRSKISNRPVTPPVQDVRPTKFVCTKSDNLLVRSSPGGSVVGEFKKGEKVYVFNQSGSWTRVASITGPLKGWSSSQFLKSYCY